MAMKLIKKTAEYKIFMRGDDRYAIQDDNGKPVNGEEKVRILVEEDLIKVLEDSRISLQEYAESMWKQKPFDNPLKSISEALVLASIIEKISKEFSKNI